MRLPVSVLPCPVIGVDRWIAGRLIFILEVGVEEDLEDRCVVAVEVGLQKWNMGTTNQWLDSSVSSSGWVKDFVHAEECAMSSRSGAVIAE